MVLDWINGYAISIAAVFLVLAGFFYVYMEKIENCVLRTAILSATRLMLVTQDVNDTLYRPAWRKITAILYDMEDVSVPIFVDSIFIQVTNLLTDELKSMKVDPPSYEVLVIKKALTVMSMWKFVIHNEPQTLRVKVSPISFAKLISSNTDE